jgi:hypothetical protein
MKTRARGTVQEVECLSSKLKALISNPSTEKEKKKNLSEP